MNLVLRNATLPNNSQGMDIAIEGGCIAAVGRALPMTGQDAMHACFMTVTETPARMRNSLCRGVRNRSISDSGAEHRDKTDA